MATRIEGKGQVAVFAKQLIAGTEKHLTGATPVTLLGSSLTPAQITAQFQTLVNLRTDVGAAQATAKAKLAAETAQTPPLRALMGAFVAYVKATYGNSPDVLADFGITLKSRAPLTTEAMAAAVVKRAATRVARHTMGTQQKKGIKGAVTGVIVTPVTAASPTVAAPSSPSAPATSTGTTAAPVAHTA
jgi:hypothetical protein